MTAEELSEKISAGIPGASVQAIDARGDGRHWQVLVTSTEFEGKSRLERHKIVMSAIQDLFPEKIHAIEIKPFTPGEVGS